MKFIRKIIKNVEHYTNFIKGIGNNGKPSIAVEFLKKLTGETFSLHYVLLLAAAKLPKSIFDQFVSQVESFLFYYLFTKSHTKELDRNFPVWAREVRYVTSIENPKEQYVALNKFITERFEKNIIKKTQELDDDFKTPKI